MHQTAEIEDSKKFIYTWYILRCIYDVLIVDVNFSFVSAGLRASKYCHRKTSLANHDTNAGCRCIARSRQNQYHLTDFAYKGFLWLFHFFGDPSIFKKMYPFSRVIFGDLIKTGTQ